MNERDRYQEVGAATRASIEGVIETAEGHELTQLARVYLAVLHQTTSWSRLSDRAYRAQLAERAQVDDKRAGVYLATLRERGAIAWIPSERRGRPSLVGLPGSIPIQPPLLASLSGGDLAAVGGATYEPLGPPATGSLTRRSEKDRVAIANVAHRACDVCAKVPLFGYVQATIFYCERHRQDVA